MILETSRTSKVSTNSSTKHCVTKASHEVHLYRCLRTASLATNVYGTPLCCATYTRMYLPAGTASFGLSRSSRAATAAYRIVDVKIGMHVKQRMRDSEHVPQCRQQSADDTSCLFFACAPCDILEKILVCRRYVSPRAESSIARALRATRTLWYYRMMPAA